LDDGFDRVIHLGDPFGATLRFPLFAEFPLIELEVARDSGQGLDLKNEWVEAAFWSLRLFMSLRMARNVYSPPIDALFKRIARHCFKFVKKTRTRRSAQT